MGPQAAAAAAAALPVLLLWVWLPGCRCCCLHRAGREAAALQGLHGLALLLWPLRLLQLVPLDPPLPLPL